MLLLAFNNGAIELLLELPLPGIIMILMISALGFVGTQAFASLLIDWEDEHVHSFFELMETVWGSVFLGTLYFPVAYLIWETRDHTPWEDIFVYLFFIFAVLYGLFEQIRHLFRLLDMTESAREHEKAPSA